MADPLSIVASILQLVTAAKASIDMVRDIANAPKEQRSLFAEVGNLEPLLKSFEGRLQANPSVHGMLSLKDPLAQFKDTMEHVMAKLRSANKPGSKIPKALSWTLWNKKEAEEDLVKMERFKALLNMWLVLDIWDIGQQQQNNHDQIFKAVTDTAEGHHREHDEIVKAVTEAAQGHRREQDVTLNKITDVADDQRKLINWAEAEHAAAERKRIIEWMSPLNFFLRHDDISRARQAGTGVWLLKDTQFEDWTTTTGSTLWCYGMPGAGKTVLSSTIVDYLRDKFPNNVGTACAYLNHKEKVLQSPENILAGLWRQLIFGRAILSGSPAHTLYHKHHEKGTRPSVDEMHTLLSSEVAGYSKVYFVIDALDEYPEHQRHILLKHLAELMPKVNLLLTSRPHITPEMFFPNTSALEIQATEEDICRYLNAQIQNSFRLSKHVQSRPELRQEIENQIIRNVDGMFLLAKLHIDSLTIKNTVKAVREALENLPKDLEHTYNEAMDRIEAQSQDDRNIARRVLIWIANAKRPLSVAELQEAIAIEPGTKTLDRDGLLDPDIFLSVCAGLVVINLADGTVRFIHYTTQDYMDCVQTTKFPYAQTEIAQGCLTYILDDDFLQLPYLDHELDSLVQEHALLDYSFRYCLVHATGKPELILQEMILAFLAHAPRWLHRFWPLIRNQQCTPSSWDIYDDDVEPPEDLFISAMFNLQETTKYILAHYTFILDQHKGQSLIGASQSGSFGVIQLLISQGANMNAQGGYYGNALQAAALEGHEAVVQLLLNQGANVNAQGGEYWTALQAASLEGHETVVQLLLNRSADVSAQGGRFGTALQAASRNGHEAVVQLLLNQGANVNAQGGEYGNALQAASSYGHEAVVQLFLSRGADVNAQGGQFGTALRAASSYGHEAVVQLLLSRGADVNAQGGKFGFGTALRAASEHGHTAVAQLLLAQGADVNLEDGEFGTALWAALFSGHETVVQLLLDRHTDVNAEVGGYGNILQAASLYGHEAVVQLLLNRGADVNAQGGTYGSALQAALSNGHEAVVQLLLDKGADVNAEDEIYGTALQVASTLGHEAVVQLLLSRGADVNAQGGKFGNALQAASNKGYEAVVQLLLDSGANVNVQGGKFGNALQAASFGGNAAIVQLILNRSADVNAHGGYYGNALQAASNTGHEAVVQLLLDRGADVNAKGGKFVNALQAASMYGHEAVVQLLLDRGADVNVWGGEFGTALQAASINGHEEVIKLLLVHGALPNEGFESDEEEEEE
ncbi:ankyrin repeat domain-containing protein [Mycena rebaudengoi]|nr:ankyrin repeat domain-containing protein [Mycena rebaudengoi]